MFEDNPEKEWEFYIAQELGMTVGEMRNKMSNLEFQQWLVFFGREAQRRELAAKG
jgi:hypothetical protein